MADWYKIRLTLPSGVTEEIKQSICNHFLEKDYDFPRECINGESSYRSPRLNAKDIIQDLYEKFNIDNAKLQFAFTEDDLDERHEIYSYKSLFWKNAEKKKIYDIIEKMIVKYNLSTRSKVSCSVSINESRFGLHIYWYFTSDGVEYKSEYSKYFSNGLNENVFKEIEERFNKFSEILNVVDTASYSENFKVNDYD